MVPKCVTACCNALIALPPASLLFEHVLAIYTPGGGPIPPSLLGTKDFNRVLETACTKLLQLFGDAKTVVASPSLTERLLQLPPSAMLALLGSDKLTANCEESVLLMLSWWLEGDEGKDVLCDAEMLFELTKNIRYSRISPSFLVQALPLVPHLSPTLTQLSDLEEFRSVASQSMLLLKSLETSCPAEWFKPSRLAPIAKDPNTVSLTLDISSEQLSDHIIALKTGGTAPASFSVSEDYRGFEITLSFSSADAAAGGKIGPVFGDSDGGTHQFSVFLSASARLPSYNSMTELPRGIIASSKITLHSTLPGQAMSYVFPKCFYTNRGLCNFHQRVSSVQGDPKALWWWDPFIIDDHVRITAEFKDERI